MSKLFLGVDVSSNKLDISFTTDGLKYDSVSIINNEGSILGFIEFLNNEFPSYDFYFGYESTSNYMLPLKKVLTNHFIKQVQINPYMMSHYLKHLDSRKKNDLIDSIGITKYLLTQNTDTFNTVFSESETSLRKYTASLNLLRKIETQIRNLTHAYKNIKVECIDNLINELLLKIKDIKKELEKESINYLKQVFPYVKNIKDEIKGVGYALLLELLPIFLKSKNNTSSQIQSYIGLTPTEYTSGSSVHRKKTISKRGNSLVRKMLFLSTMCAIRFNQIIKEKYERLLNLGKTKMVAMVACMSHLFRAIHNRFLKYAI